MFTFAALWTIPETLPETHRNREPLGRAVNRYGALLKNRQILGYAGVGGFLYAGMFAYIAGTPFAYINYYHVPEERYGLLFGLVVVGIMAANMLNSRLVVRHGYEKILFWGALVAALAAGTTALTARTGWGGLWGLAVPISVFVSTTGFIVANSITGALAHFPKQAGAVSALVGAIHYGSGIIGSALVGTLSDKTPWPMGLVIGITGVGCLLSTTLISKQTRPTNH